MVSPRAESSGLRRKSGEMSTPKAFGFGAYSNCLGPAQFAKSQVERVVTRFRQNLAAKTRFREIRRRLIGKCP